MPRSRLEENEHSIFVNGKGQKIWILCKEIKHCYEGGCWNQANIVMYALAPKIDHFCWEIPLIHPYL